MYGICCCFYFVLLVNAPSPSLCRVVGASTNMTKASSTCGTPVTTTDVNSNADYILCQNMGMRAVLNTA